MGSCMIILFEKGNHSETFFIMQMPELDTH